MKFSLLKDRILRKSFPVIFEYSSKTDDNVNKGACFFEVAAGFSLPASWVLVNADISGNTYVSEAYFLLDFGNGFEDADRYGLNCLNGQVYGSTLDLPVDVVSLCLVIMIKGDNLRQQQLQVTFVPICKTEALTRVALYLYKINKLRGISAAQVLGEKWYQIRKAGVRNIIHNLDSFYDYADAERPVGYLQWIQRTERITAEERREIINRSFPDAPQVNVVCNYEQHARLLQKTITSLQRQIYKNWLLTVVVDSRKAADALQRECCCGSESRIVFHVVSREDESAIQAKVEGDYLLWIIPGDTLSPFALFYWIEVINDHPEKLAWYCDSDLINEEGERENPHCRPGWNRELFYSQNYINTCCLFQRKGILKVTGAVELVDRWAQYEFFLRCIEQGLEEKIGHIPKVLYHFHSEKDCDLSLYNERAGYESDALQAHFYRLGQTVSVLQGKLKGGHRLQYPLPKILPRVTIVIPTRDQVKILKQCIASLFQLTSYPDYDIIVVNNGSEQKATFTYFDEIKSDPRISILDYDQPFNFAAINNYAVRQTDAEIVCLLNNDMEIISAEWLEEMVRYGVLDDIGCVGAKLLFANGLVQHARCYLWAWRCCRACP